ncbi:MAG: DNA translocase FtsK [Clostridia bacterium]|nr:DNA translocase FtsK [Clostridia bacterium]
MAKSNQLREQTKKPNEIIGLVLLALGIYSLISLNMETGLVGGFIQRILVGLAGKGAFIIPLGLVAYGIKLIIKGKNTGANAKTYGLMGFVLVFLAFLHVHQIQPNHFWDYGLQGMGGGLIGALLAIVLVKAFGMVGTYIILTTLALVNIILLTNGSLSDWTMNLGGFLNKGWRKTRAELNDFMYEIVEEDEEEDKSGPSGGKPSIKNEGPVIIDHSHKQVEKPSAKGRAIINMAKGVLEHAMPKVNVYPEAWEENQSPAGDKGGLDSGDIQEHDTEEDEEHPAVEEVKETSRISAAAQEEIVEDIGPVQPRTGSYRMPPVSLLARPMKIKNTRLNKDITDNVKILEETLDNFGVRAKVTQVSRGPAITRYELQPAPGVKVSRIVNLADDIALSMAAPDVRIEAPIPGKAAVGIEVPNKEISMVYLRELVETPEFNQAVSGLSVVLGKDIAGQPIITDLAKMPHLLIAGSTGSGKSICMNTLIASILYKARPDQVKFLMIDPKMVELATYNGIPHLIAPVVTDPKKAATALRWVVSEMENRYALFAGTGVKNITGFNAMKVGLGEEPLPMVVVLIDELADLMMVAPADVEDAICRLAQMARAAGIHLVVATQRPSVDVITGLIKANIPSRIAFAVSSQIDSRTILDMAGAEKLLGKGDMLFFPVGAAKPLRVQGVFVSEKEIEELVNFVKNQAIPEYEEGVLKAEPSRTEKESGEEDELLPEALRILIESGQASISMLQRRLRIGYTRAARLIDIMEEKGFVGGYEGSKPRAIHMTLEQWENTFGQRQ